MAERRIYPADPHRIRAERERRFGSQTSFASAVRVARPLTGAVSSRTISNIEGGKGADAHIVGAVTTLLFPETAPSVEGPRPGQRAGDWLRELRESQGISKTTFARQSGLTARAGGK